jgi:hypothetical protein
VRQRQRIPLISTAEDAEDAEDKTGQDGLFLRVLRVLCGERALKGETEMKSVRIRYCEV